MVAPTPHTDLLSVRQPKEHHMKKILAALSIAGLALAGFAAPAQAEEDNFGCLPAEQGWAVFQAAIAPDIDRNGDGLICGKQVGGQPNAPIPGFTFTDNKLSTDETCNWGQLTAEAIAGGFEQGPHASSFAGSPRLGLANVVEQGNLAATCELLS